MSKYTIELGEIAQSITNMYTDDTESIIQAAIPLIFNAYPIFDESYRNTLNTAIMSAFYWREIGFETYGRWKFELHALMNRIMPYYNKLYESTLIEYNPIITYFENRNEVRTGGEKNNDTGNNNESNISTSDTLNSTNDTTLNLESQSITENQNDRQNNNANELNIGESKTNESITAADYSNALNEASTTQDAAQNSAQYHTANDTADETTNKSQSGSIYSNNINNQDNTSDTLKKQSNTPQNALTNLLNDRYLTQAEQDLNNAGQTNGTTGVENTNSYDRGAGQKLSGNVAADNTNMYNRGNGLSITGDIKTAAHNTYNTNANDQTNSRILLNNNTTDRFNINGNTRMSNDQRSGTGKVNNHSDYILSRLTANNRDRNYTDALTSTVSGKNGGQSIASLIMDYRNALINVDALIIAELNFLFMLIY